MTFFRTKKCKNWHPLIVKLFLNHSQIGSMKPFSSYFQGNCLICWRRLYDSPSCEPSPTVAAGVHAKTNQLLSTKTVSKEALKDFKACFNAQMSKVKFDLYWYVVYLLHACFTATQVSISRAAVQACDVVGVNTGIATIMMMVLFRGLYPSKLQILALYRWSPNKCKPLLLWLTTWQWYSVLSNWNIQNLCANHQISVWEERWASSLTRRQIPVARAGHIILDSTP